MVAVAVGLEVPACSFTPKVVVGSSNKPGDDTDWLSAGKQSEPIID